MKRLIVFFLCVLSLSMLWGQRVMVIEYENGLKRAEYLNQISQITFPEPSEWHDNQTPEEVSRGMQAYYTFDLEQAEDWQGNCPGFMNGGSFILDTPNMGGKALLLKEGEFVNIPYIPLNGRSTYTISIWVKDFGTGCIFKSIGDNIYGPSLFVTADMKLHYYTGISATYSSIKFNTDLSAFQTDQWTMLTVVTETEPTSSSTYNGTSTLYVNGKRADSGTCRTSSNSGSALMVIGGHEGVNLTSKLAEPMKVDNLRLYSVALTDDEIKAIYERESQLNSITVSTQRMVLDANTDQQSFSVYNQTSLPTKYSVSTTVGNLNISPSSGEIPAMSAVEVTAKVDNRNQTDYESGIISIVAEKAKYAIMTEIYRGSQFEVGKIAVPRSLCAYYTFDDGNANNMMQAEGHGVCTGGRYVTDTPNGKGKALYLKEKDYVDLPWAPLDGKSSYSFSMWVKDFGVGCLFKSLGKNLYGPSLFVTEQGKWLYQTGTSEKYSSVTYSLDVAPFQRDEWTMLTVVTETPPSSSSTTTGTSTLYINGRRAGSGFSRTSDKGATSMMIGGQRTLSASSLWAEAMTVDNIRLYSVALTDNEVAAIYAAEKNE